MKNMKKMKGQVMLLTTVMLSAAILSATSLAALLVLYQLRQTSDVAASTKAIFAADSGIECILFNQFRTTAVLDCDIEGKEANFQNGAQFKILNLGATSKSVGRAGRSARSLEITF